MTLPKKPQLPSFFSDLQYQDVFGKIDPQQALAIIGATILIKNGIDFTQTKIIPALADVGGSMIMKAFPWIKLQEFVKIKGDTEPLEWLMSLMVAYIIVVHFDKVASLGSNILGIAKSLLF